MFRIFLLEQLPLIGQGVVSFDMIISLICADAAHAVHIVVDSTDALCLPWVAHVSFASHLLCLDINLDVYFLHDKVPILLCLASQIVPSNHIDVRSVDLDYLWPHRPTERVFLLL